MYQLKMALLIVVCLFFIAVGIDLLISSYQLNDPFSFVLTFFASNLMILISAALGLGFAIRLKRRITGASSKETPPQDKT